MGQNTLHKINKYITSSVAQAQSFSHHNAFDPHKFQSLTIFYSSKTKHPLFPYRSTKLAPLKWE